MMNSLMLGTLTFLMVAPAISICDAELSKSSESSEKHPNEISGAEYDNENAINEPWSFYRQLRAPSGFQGVRGKKDYDEFDNDLFASPKRAPSQAFFGMRGKKYFDDKRAPASFYGVRGKKEDFQNDDLQAQLYRDLILEKEKIANFVEDYMDEKEKRKPSGFVGLRGKKSVNNDDYLDYEKRAPVGFQGVRGKKDEYPNFIGSGEKRVPATGFFGMRGKKQPFVGYQSSPNFFGVRKKPYMPYGKFVGVRGKKAQDKRFRLEPDELNPADLRPAPRVSADATQDKRIGFIGMRG